MGQVHVESVRAGRVPELFAALGRAGFDVAPARPGRGDAEQYRCKRGDRAVVVAVSPGRPGADEVFVVLGHPPYSLRPWRWAGDVRTFAAITDVLDDFHFLD